MKIFKYILLAIVFLGSEEIAFSQYYLKSIYESLSLESDSVLLYFNEDNLDYYIDLRAAYPGTIDWHASSDLVNWRSLDKHNDSLRVRIDSSAYYRATYIEGTCYPVMSVTAFLIEKVTITGSNQFTVDSMGGVFLLPSGIKVKVPIGAVSAPKDIKVEILGFDEANSLATIYTDENSFFLSGISISTDVFDFTKPIKIKIPHQNLDVTGQPLLYQLDSINTKSRQDKLIVPTKDKEIKLR
jgi:hypothetical protein